MEVIDFNDLMKEERFVATPSVSKEAQKKSFTQSVIIAILLCIIAFPVYFFVRLGGGASDEGALMYHSAIGEVFTGMHGQYPNFKSATCTERNSSRNDCIEFTFVFYPQDDPETVGTAMSTVDKAYGVSDTDLTALKATIKQIIEFKRQYIYGRRAPLTVLVLSSNMSRGGVIEEVKMKCVESDNDVMCENVR